MIATRNEHTLATACDIVGRGYWSGRTAHVRCVPADAGTGIQFQRVDLPGQPVCPLRSELVDAIAFRTNLGRGAVQFEMIEHLVAALRGLEIDNCLVQTDQPEMPGLDGSSRSWTNALQAAGLVIQPATRKLLRIRSRIEVRHQRGVLIASPTEGNDAIYEYQLDYGPASVIRAQSFRITLSPEQFTRHVAAARTFVTESQARDLRQRGLGQHVGHDDLVVIGAAGPIENTFRFPNECARHKTLDLIGDLATVGVDLIGRFTSVRGGHQLNAMLARELQQLVDRCDHPQSSSSLPPHIIEPSMGMSA